MSEQTIGNAHRVRPLHLRVHAGIFVAWAVLALTFLVARYWPEGLLANGLDLLSSALKRGLHWTTSLLPVGLHEVTILALVILGLVWAARAVSEALMRRRRWRHVIAGGVLTVVSFTCVLDAWANVVGGVARRKLVHDLGWDGGQVPKASPEQPDRQAPPTADELLRWCDELAEGVNREYFAAFATDDIGQPTPALPPETLNEAVEGGYRRAAAAWNLPAVHVAAYGPAKRTIFSPVLWYLSGYMSFHTQEALYNPVVPAHTQPFVVAHEKAHQRGILTEDEANLLGYLACVHSDHPYARYSGYWSALSVMSGSLRALDPEAMDSVTASLGPGAQRDMKAVPPKGWFQDELGDVVQAAHDSILRYGGEERGVTVYEDAKLFIILARKNDGFVIRTEASAESTTSRGSNRGPPGIG